MTAAAVAVLAVGAATYLVRTRADRDGLAILAAGLALATLAALLLP